MKAHTVKSNAKRAAKKFAERYQRVTVESPEEATAGGWYATVMLDGTPSAEIVDAAKASDVLLVQTRAYPDPALAPGHTDLMISPEAIDEEVASFTDEDHTIIAGEKPASLPTPPKPVDIPEKPRPLAGPEFAKAVADIPKTRSSAEEIEARRAERRARVKEEKAAGVRDAAGNKIDPAKVAKGPKRADIIVHLASRPDGVTVEDLMKATGWQRHTLRGYIAGTLRKRGHAIECVQAKGEPTRYAIKSGAA